MRRMHWRRESFQPGMTIFRQGEEGQDAYLIEQGSVHITKTETDGQEVLLRTLGEGEIFGEIALVDNLPRTATATAAEPTVLVGIHSQLFFNKIKQSDPLLSHLLGVVVNRFRGGHPSQDISSHAATNPMAAFRDYVVNNIRVSQDLSEAIEREEFEVHFQPIVHLQDGSLAGFEALIRWNRREVGLVSPLEFIGLAEATGLIVPLTNWVAAEALRNLPGFQETMDRHHPGHAGLFMSLNLSAGQLLEPSALDEVVQVVRESGIEPGRIKFEITESTMIEDADAAIGAMRRLKEMGLLLAIDDFGTGYSSLSYLERMPLDNLKIDRSFVVAMRDQLNGQRIARAIAALAHELGMDCIAEGVEEASDEQALQSFGCKYGQGYRYAKPMRAEQAIDYIVRRGSGAG